MVAGLDEWRGADRAVVRLDHRLGTERVDADLARGPATLLADFSNVRGDGDRRAERATEA